jgi:hypothetical protein
MTLFLPWHKVVVRYKTNENAKFTITFYDDNQSADYSDIVKAAVHRANELWKKENMTATITAVEVSRFRE